MPWYGWILVALFVLIAVVALAIRLLRVSRRGRRFLGLPMRGKIAFGRALLSDPRVPLPAKVLLAVAVAYLALPFDLIPDFIPVIGQLDDAFVVIGAVAILMALVPREQFETALKQAEFEIEERRAAAAKVAEAPPPKELSR